MKNLYFTGYLTGRVSAWVLKTVLQTDGGDVAQQCACASCHWTVPLKMVKF